MNGLVSQILSSLLQWSLRNQPKGSDSPRANDVSICSQPSVWSHWRLKSVIQKLTLLVPTTGNGARNFQPIEGNEAPCLLEQHQQQKAMEQTALNTISLHVCLSNPDNRSNRAGCHAHLFFLLIDERVVKIFQTSTKFPVSRFS